MAPPKHKPADLGRDTVVLVGGPRDGRVHWHDELKANRDAYHPHHEDYRPADPPRMLPTPHQANPDQVSHVWEYRPGIDTKRKPR